ncbi:MAG TPA: ABC transporter ATP-binding protein [Egibacteraceae bacterium]
MTEPVIATRGLTKRYGDATAVEGLTLEVYPGEIFGLLGPNGAGKTTTILMLLGLSEPTSGEVQVLGLDPTRQSLEVKRRVGYLPDAVGFYERSTGRENLQYTAALNRLPEDVAARRIDELLELVGLTDAADDPVGTYSRGMRQRLGVADALVKDPAVLILDEPTTAIDPEGVAQMLDLIRGLARDRGVALLLSSHLLHQVQSVCDRVGIFVAGRMVASGPMEELAKQVVASSPVVEVRVGGDVQAAADVLRAVPGVERCDLDSESPDGLVVVVDDDTVVPRLANRLVHADIPLLHLRRRGDELDEIYRHWFGEEAGEEVKA